ncbi:BRO-N domain-containing protein [Methylocystis sp.]|uniref:BRO-N domain-containing protein n=1 Tax=Methylocystis sp. TaxID=1911079 RepID=UPI003D0BFE97
MQITPFLFENAKLIRSVDQDAAPWFVAEDVCEALGLGHAEGALRKLDPEEKGATSISTPGGPQEMLIISESGLYALVLRCRDAMTPGSTAHRFRKWVTSEVLPSIRKTGGYGASTSKDDIREVVREIFSALVDCALLRRARRFAAKRRGARLLKVQ